MIKLIASDLDGTLLLDGAQTLPEGTCDQIRRLKEQGILFVAASGRQYANLRRLFAPVADDIAYICENGCIVFYKGKMIHKELMDRETGQEIIKAILEKESAEVLLSGEDTSYLQPKQESFLYRIRDVVKNNVTVVDDILGTQESYFKISVYEKDGIGDTKAYWENRFGDRLTVVTSGNEWLDMMPFSVNKGSAMQVLTEYLGIRPEECMAFGDNYNDVEMLKFVGSSYAMDTAQPGIGEICRYHTDTVGHALEKHMRENSRKSWKKHPSKARLEEKYA
ncbi:MAG: HAD family hydrolase [Clostridia bacterium]|nr:HAD family hydrolase [Clostridia bacterium]NCC44801.1 HAD family hydrolase [Clostridia bacterium]